jgi:hypothetical protein
MSPMHTKPKPVTLRTLKNSLASGFSHLFTSLRAGGLRRLRQTDAARAPAGPDQRRGTPVAVLGELFGPGNGAVHGVGHTTGRSHTTGQALPRSSLLGASRNVSGAWGDSVHVWGGWHRGFGARQLEFPEFLLLRPGFQMTGTRPPWPRYWYVVVST